MATEVSKRPPEQRHSPSLREFLVHPRGEAARIEPSIDGPDENDGIFIPDFDDDSPKPVGSKRTRRRAGRTSSRPLPSLVDLVWAATIAHCDLSPLDRSGPKICIVKTPSAAWTDLVVGLFAEFGRPALVLKAVKSRDIDQIHKAIDQGYSLIIITHAIDVLSPGISAGADCHIEVSLVTPDILAELIRQVTRKRVAKRNLALLRKATMLEPHDIALLVRDGRSIDAIIKSIDAVFTSMNANTGARRIPDLATTRAFGDAGIWGRQLAEDLRAWRSGEISWNEVDRGCLLWGPPGTGKTLFAQSLAAHCGIPITISSIGQLFASSDGHLGGVVKAVRRTFAEACAQTPGILFLDEVDGLPNRAKLDSRNRDFWMPVIGEFLTLLDGAISSREGLIVVAATNLVDLIDPALLRPGRLERSIHLGPPDAAGLAEAIRLHLGEDLGSVDLMPFCAAAVGMTPADAMAMVREARRRARRIGRALTIDDLWAVSPVGEPTSPAMRWRIAVHEAGHALISHRIGWRIERIVVNAHGAGKGYVKSRAPEELIPTKSLFLNEIRVLLAGRAAEESVLGEPSAGAGFSETSDLGRATELAAILELSSGLGSHLSVLAPDEALTLATRSPSMMQRVEGLLRELYRSILDELNQQKELLIVVARAAFERGDIDEQAIEILLA